MPELVTGSCGHQWERSSHDSRLSNGVEACPICSRLDASPPPRRAALLQVDKLENWLAEAPMALLPAGSTAPTNAGHTARTNDGQPLRNVLPIVDGYDVVELVGYGGMGIVYKAIQRSLRRIVALKMIDEGLRGRTEQRARFHREALAVARLSHPNIVQIHEVGEHDGRPYLALEFVEGGSLDRRFGEGPMPVRAAVELVEVLAQAAHYAHTKGVVHRDLKPSNVLVTADGTPKINDFGLAKHGQPGSAEWDDDPVGYHTRTGQVIGTPRYMAPEQADGRGREVGPATDIYALGVILYEALTGRPPFLAASLFEVLEQIRSQEATPLRRLRPSVPRDLDTICMVCLQKEPQRRYPTAARLAADLRRFLEGAPILARPVSIREKTLKWICRKPAAAALIGLTMLTCVSAVLGIVGHNAVLQKQIQRAKSEESRADDNYRQAQATIHDMLDILDRKQMADMPQLQELRRDQMKAALAFYQGVLSQLENPHAALRRDAARAYQATADIQIRLGQTEEAQLNTQTALRLYQQLLQDDPADDELRGAVADGYRILGNLKDSSHAEQALDNHRQADRIYLELTRNPGGSSIWRDRMARNHNQWAARYQTMGRSETAIEHYHQALAIHQSLLHEDPDNRQRKFAVAQVLVNLANMRGSQPDFAQAEAHLLSLVAEHPEDVEFATTLAMLYGNWANLVQSDQISADRALELYAKDMAIAEAVLRQEPNWAAAKRSLLNAHGARALLLEHLGRLDEAVKDWDQVVNFSAGVEREKYQIARAQRIGRLGDAERTMREVDTLLESRHLTGETLYSLAQILACALADMPNTGSQPKKQHVVERAMGLLEQAHASGWFTDPERRKLLDAPEFDLLRTRDDFRSLFVTVRPQASN